MIITISIAFFALLQGAYSTNFEPKTLTSLYHEYGLIVRGKVLSISYIPEKNMTQYNFQILEYVTPTQQFKTITAFSNSSVIPNVKTNQTQTSFFSGDVVQLYLDNSTSGYYISPYSFALPGNCKNSSIGPNYVSVSTMPISTAAYSWRLFDSRGNLITGDVPVNKEIFVKASGDIINASPFENRTIEISIIREGDTKPVLQYLKQIDMQPCSLIDPNLEFTPEQTGNYSISVKLLGGIYDGKIIIDNSTDFTSSFSVSNSNGGNITGTSDTNFSVRSGMVLSNQMSPLKQFQVGIPVNKVTCEQGLEVIQSVADGSPACVKPDTAHILVKRGWGHLP
ncbi:MAG: hypothetical protein KGI27_08800 [Thaumarchaeota archaeon]|nr:hypothetical protein [Nitrososphaerota archaeon]